MMMRLPGEAASIVAPKAGGSYRYFLVKRASEEEEIAMMNERLN